MKRKSAIRRSSFNFHSPSWKDRNKKEGGSPTNNSNVTAQRNKKNKSNEALKKARSSELKCFKCLGIVF